MEKIARQSRLNSSTKIPRSATLNENDVMIIWVLRKIFFFFKKEKLTN